MSRKNKSRLSKKERRRDRRKIKKSLKGMENARKFLKEANAVGNNVVTEDNQQTGVNSRRNVKNDFAPDEKPSTSQHCKKYLSPKNVLKRSPWKNAGGKLNRFKKIVDDQAKRLVRRSVHIVNDNQIQRNATPKRNSSQKKESKRAINNSRANLKKRRITTRRNKKNINTLEEGEIRSDNDLSEICGDDDDDCIVIESNLEEITIDDDDIPSTSDVSTSYQFLMKSFKERVSSTPCNSKNSNLTSVLDTQNSTNDEAIETLPFFVDIGRGSGIQSINSTDTFMDYTKLSTLKESFQKIQRKIRLKENTSDEVIDLDNTIDNSKDTTLKRRSTDHDDSVIFVCETNNNDFIPIVDPNEPPRKIFKASNATPKTPVNRLRTNNLFTLSETKKLHEYNENAYNPSANEELTTGKRMVIIDGSNVAFKHGLDQGFSVKGLKIAIDYFEKMGHEVKAVIPQFRMNSTKSTDPEALEKLHKSGKIVQTPCKNLPGFTSTSYDDRFILQLAFELDAAIVSNDNYRDLLHENPVFKKIIENRVIGYTWCNDIFILPKDPYGKWGPTLHSILNRS